MSRVALDVMGGDHAPEANLEGGIAAVDRGDLRADELLLVGTEATVRACLEGLGQDPRRFHIADAPDALAGDESPVEALRRKPRNSIAVGVGLVKRGEADVFVSAGSTGVVVAAATVGLRCLEGIRRPGIAVTVEGQTGPFMVIDVGANPQPKPQHLLHYALMGSAYYHDTFGKERPRIGLMNIGSEDAKGNPLIKETRELLKRAPIDFIGNIEGSDVFSGRCDVVISDGFTGNVLLKVSEGVAEYMLRTFSRYMTEEQVVEERQRKILRRMQRRVDFSEYGGALLLGVEGIVTICHGRSRAPAISNAIRFACKAVGARVNQHIVELVRSTSSPAT